MSSTPRITLISIMLLGLASAVSMVRSASAQQNDLVETIRNVDQSLVHIEAGDTYGSGFLLHDARTLVTNRHVVESTGIDGRVALRSVIERAGGVTDLGAPAEGVVRYLHPDHDLAVVEVVGDLGPSAVPLPVLQGGRLLPRGTAVLIHGFPGSMSPTVSRGIISGHHREFSDGGTYYLLDAAAGSGSSGGPVTDESGRLVGVASMVYDVPEDLGFNWCYALPAAAVVEMFGRNGGVDSIPRMMDVGDLVGRVRQAGRGRVQLEELRDCLKILVDTRPDLSSLLGDWIDFLDRSVRHITLTERNDGRLFMEIMIDIGAQSARRGVELGMRDDGVLDEEIELLLQQAELMQQKWGERIMQNSMVGMDEEQQVDLLVGMMDPITERLGDSVAQLPRICDRLGEIRLADEMAVRDADRRGMIRDMGELATIGSLLEIGEVFSALESTVDFSASPRRFLRGYENMIRALRSAQGAWDDLPEECRLMFEGSDAEVIRQQLADSGYSRMTSVEVTLAPGENVFPLSIPRGGSIVELVVLGDCESGADIDIGVYDPTGELIDFDEEIDSFPLVSVTRPAAGEWTMVVINNANLSVSATLQQWVQRRP